VRAVVDRGIKGRGAGAYSTDHQHATAWMHECVISERSTQVGGNTTWPRSSMKTTLTSKLTPIYPLAVPLPPHQLPPPPPRLAASCPPLLTSSI
jgi:hypothetical protein